MSAEKRIVIQHTDGKFYSWPTWDFEVDNDIETYLFDDETKTDDLDFPIGSRVYFQGIGWTEVCEEINDCDGCTLIDKNCHLGICLDKIFKKLELSSAQFYVLNTKTSHTSVIHTTEESARNEAERLSKKQPGDVFKVLKVVASCQSEAIIKWSDK